MPTYRTPALILRTYDYSEADRVLVLFTRHYGKVRAVAKGVRRSCSHLGGCLNWISHAELQLHGRHEHQELLLITQGQLLSSYPRLKLDLPALGLAARMAELLSEFMPDRQPLPEMFELASTALQLLDEGVAPPVIALWFEVSLLDGVGYRPRLETCRVCASPHGAMAYHAESGGVVCRRCRPFQGTPVSEEARSRLHGLIGSHADWVRHLQLEPACQREMAAVLEAALHYQLGHKLKTDTFRLAVAALAE